MYLITHTYCAHVDMQTRMLTRVVLRMHNNITSVRFGGNSDLMVQLTASTFSSVCDHLCLIETPPPPTSAVFMQKYIPICTSTMIQIPIYKICCANSFVFYI